MVHDIAILHLAEILKLITGIDVNRLKPALIREIILNFYYQMKWFF